MSYLKPEDLVKYGITGVTEVVHNPILRTTL